MVGESVWQCRTLTVTRCDVYAKAVLGKEISDIVMLTKRRGN